MPRLLLLPALLFCLLFFDSAEAASKHPNIIYILADDLGIGDLSCYNPESKIQTPHVDRMAAEGVRFTDAHTPSAVCTPTRYGILTGRYCWRTRLKYRVLDGFDPPLIEPAQVTVPTLLRKAGYDTHCVGKWHLGMQWTDRNGAAVPAVPIDRKAPPRPGFNIDFSRPVTGGPIDVGFDTYFGISASLNMSPFCYLVNDRPYRLPTLKQEKIRTEFIAVDEGVRSPDFSIYGVMPRFAGEAVRVIEEQAENHPDRPFFLYAPLSSPHLPVVPNEEYRGKSEAGEYGDFVVETDAFTGAILEALDRTGLTENTLVIFTSDNGGLYHWWEPEEADDVANYQLRGRGAAMKEFGHQGNAHLRGTKADIWEGGHRVPFVVRWPGKTPKGTVSDELIELTDLLRTCAAITETALPGEVGSDSRNILPALLSERPESPVRDFAVHHSLWGVFAIRQGPWKMIPHRGSGGFTFPKELDPAKVGGPEGQLYHLKNDPSEAKNLWDEEPEVVSELKKLLQQVQDAGY
ncbi:MAG: arylsulfatase [Verrucomicrobiales bacterium]|nr:arylsulfatase [Verrucomicrobiales bacterium]